jgi:hypothetical protein
MTLFHLAMFSMTWLYLVSFSMTLFNLAMFSMTWPYLASFSMICKCQPGELLYGVIHIGELFHDPITHGELLYDLYLGTNLASFSMAWFTLVSIP